MTLKGIWSVYLESIIQLCYNYGSYLNENTKDSKAIFFLHSLCYACILGVEVNNVYLKINGYRLILTKGENVELSFCKYNAKTIVGLTVRFKFGLY